MNATLRSTLRPSLLLAGLCLGAALASPAWADGDPRTDDVPRLLPYSGILERDGQPINASGDAALHIEFALYDGPGAEQAAYRQHIIVEVYSGHFTSTIGPVGRGPADEEVFIDELISRADDLYLGMTLLGDPDDPADDIALSNRQRIHATPYAMWTTSATDLSVARDVRVGGNVEIAGDLAVGGALRLPEGSLSGREIADRSLRVADLAAESVGEGLVEAGDALAVDEAWLDDQIRSWVRGNCRVSLGWRDGCNNCGSAPAKHVTVQANGTCTGARGSDTSCRDNGNWGGVNTDGGVNNDDVFYIRFVCN